MWIHIRNNSIASGSEHIADTKLFTDVTIVTLVYLFGFCCVDGHNSDIMVHKICTF
jgi:hypothetical protein